MYPALYKNQFKRGTRRLLTWNYNWESIYFITICTSQKEHFFGKVINGEMVLNELGKTASEEWLKTQEIRKDMNVELFDFVIMPNHMHAILKIGWNQYNTQIIDPNELINTTNFNQTNNSNDPHHPNHPHHSGSCAMLRAATMNNGATQMNDDAATMNNGATQMNDDAAPMDGNAAPMNDDAAPPDIFSSFVPDQIVEIIEAKKKSNNKFGPQAKNLASIIRGFKSAVTTKARIAGNHNFEWQSRFHEHIIGDERAFRNIQRYIRNNPKKWVKKMI